ncbi:MAG: hypothetical protein HY235_01560 [Acidobacteria bacterium]|nr:hypothetical protein [Acidobacteriota bacterium]
MNHRRAFSFGTPGLLAGFRRALTAGTSERAGHTVRIPQEFTSLLNPDRWSYDFLPRFRRPDRGQDAVVWMHNREGALTIAETPVKLGTLDLAMPLAISASPAGGLWVSLEAWSGARNTGVLTRFSSRGAIEFSVQLGDFAGEVMLVDDSGRVWLFGGPVVERFKKDPNVDFDTMLIVDPNGRSLRRGLRKSSFHIDARPSQIRSAGEPQLLQHADRVSIISPVANSWVVLDLHGNEVTRFAFGSPEPGPRSGRWKLLSAFGTPTGRVLAFFTAAHSPLRDSGLFEFNLRKRAWSRLLEVDPTRSFGGLFGTTGEEAILRSGPDLYGWFTLPAAP